ncbi:YkgJ family cysteine cluster protein [bacterium]|nr:YkgJ family cysteine cluster protein [bacterium]
MTPPKEEHRGLVRQLKKRPPSDLDARIHTLHHEAFEQIDCLSCANCCKTTGPLLIEKDIERLAKRLRLKPAEFQERYLRKDEEGDLVLQTLPCPFLGADNYCSVYHDRPKACREYPHTDRRRQAQILDLSLKNTVVCPAVAFIFDRLLETLPPPR